jgi:hypothetical protein
MGDPQRIAMVGEATCHSVGEAKTPIGHRQQHDAAVGADATAIESGCDFLAGDRWKRERQEVIVGHGERGWREVANGIGVSNQTLRQINALSYVRQPQIHPLMNKTG